MDIEKYQKMVSVAPYTSDTKTRAVLCKALYDDAKNYLDFPDSKEFKLDAIKIIMKKVEKGLTPENAIKVLDLATSRASVIASNVEGLTKSDIPMITLELITRVEKCAIDSYLTAVSTGTLSKYSCVFTGVELTYSDDDILSALGF